MNSFAFVFPGQGSQSVGMLDAWGGNPVVAQTLAEASDAMGEDIAKLIHEGPKEALGLTSASVHFSTSLLQASKKGVKAKAKSTSLFGIDIKILSERWQITLNFMRFPK